MKRIIALFVTTLFIINCFSYSVFAESNNLCDIFLMVNQFHQCYNIYNNPDIDVGGYIEREVKSDELYSASTIIAATSMIYDENPDKYVVIKSPERDPFDTSSPIVVQRPYGSYICVPENEYLNFVKSRFNVNDQLFNELRNFKVRDFTTFYDKNGTAIFNPSDNTYIVPVMTYEVEMRSPHRKFIGYAKNGSNYDVYLNLCSYVDWQSAPADKIENVDYYAEHYEAVNPTGPGTIPKVRYYKITNDWMKYTVSYDGATIKYLSNVKVNSIPSNFIRFNDVVTDEPPVESSAEILSTPKATDVTSDINSIVSSESKPATVSKSESVAESESETVLFSSSEANSLANESSEKTSAETKDLKEKNKKPIILPLVIGIFVVAVAGASVWYFLYFKKGVK